MFTKKDLLKLLLPLMVEQLLAVLVGMADVVMVAVVGEAAVSGVSLVDSISVLIIQMLAALATGGSVVCAQYIGRKEPEQACRAAGQLLLVTTLVSAVIGAAAMAEGMVARIKAELGAPDARVIATGGLAGVVAGSTDAFDEVDGQLTLKGICEIYRRMCER